ANRYFESERLNILNICVESVEENLVTNYQRSIGLIENIYPVTEDLQLISDTTQSIIILADKDGNIVTSTNEAAMKYIGSPMPAQATTAARLSTVPVNISKVFSENHTEKYYAVGKAIFAPDGAVTGYIFACTSTTSITLFTNALLSMFLLSTSVIVLVSSVVSLVVTSRMTTPLRKIAEAAKRFSQGDLSARAPVEGDDEVTYLAYTFNAMAEFADKNETSRSNFVANIAHELRTPMTSIKGFVDGIIDGTIPPDKQDSYLKIVSSEVGRLARLTNSMLDISKLDSGEFIMNVSKYNIWDTISEVAFAFESRIENADIQVRGFEPTRMLVAADKDIIHQVVYNIVDNALKFTPNGGYIGFSVTEEKGSDHITVKIRNSGDGIPQEALPYIFDRFYKTDASRSVHIKGAGIGMYIAKTLVNRSGGEIHVESELGEYTEFIFTVPAAAEKNAHGDKKAADAKAKKEKQPKGPRLKTPKHK
ncbi:MAG: HAMP domain-containing histidine kinase, partial [Oscillospiraceae bacterium]|nr:HAMP domain-containing histidine kinase [Oscillospiraceae bacterium]